MSALMIAICFSKVFSTEHSQRTDQLILSSRFGRKKLYYAKIVSGITSSLILGMAVFGSSAAVIFWCWGFDGGGTALGYDAPHQYVFCLEYFFRKAGAVYGKFLYHLADRSLYMAVSGCRIDIIRKAGLWENNVNLEGICKKSTKIGVKFLHPLEEIYIFFVYERGGQMLY